MEINEPKKMDRNETVEILISDSRLISMGSQFGHVALNINNTVYGRAPNAWDVDNKVNYIFRQQVAMHRDTWGYVLAVTKEEKAKLLEELMKHKAINRKYNLINNSCSSAMVNVFSVTDILIVDPRWNFGAITPADIMNSLKKSPRLIKQIIYPKK